MINPFPDLSAILAQHENFSQARKEILNALKNWYVQSREAVSQNFAQEQYRNAKYRHNYAKIADILLVNVYDFITSSVYLNPNPTTSESLSIMAVGGYGRNELAPFSDVDLVILIPYKQTAWHENVIETLLYLLWDMQIKLGYSVRTRAEVIPLARGDFTIRTAMLESRFIVGNSELAEQVQNDLRSELFEKTITEFIEAKLEEREKRHEKSGNIRYVLEPNVKEAKGGLRDLHTLYWIGKYITGAETPKELAQKGFFEVDELQKFQEAEEFLWATRMCLHLLSGRLNDSLSFDMQVDVARAMGFEDTSERRGVESFMQHYFHMARYVGEITRVFITELEAQNAKKPVFPFLNFTRKTVELPNAFIFINNRIDFAHEDALLNEPMNVLRLFVHALELGYLIHPNAFRLIARNPQIFDEEFINSKEANRLFLSLLLDYGNPERVLRRLNEIGFLGVFIPEWKNVDALMQYNMYHSYTVDEHTIQCISNLAQIERKQLIEELPLSSEILKKGINRRVLYIALLLHDIGKGQARPHEIIGAEAALSLCPRFGLENYETDLVSWLVRNHLEMSDAAQKRDLTDPRTAENFAKLVEDEERLDLLTVLTVCDIRGVGPKIWNNWKAMLLRELHYATEDKLNQKGVISGAAAREVLAKEKLKSLLTHWKESEIDAELNRHYRDYWLSLSTDVHFILANLIQKSLNQIEMAIPEVQLSPDKDRDATRICFSMPDHPGIFARICGALSLSGANIVDARTYTSSDGMATSIFWVQDRNRHFYDPARQGVLEKNVHKVLHGEVLPRDILLDREVIKKRESRFTVPTKIRFDNEGSSIFTIIEIETRDRAALVYDIAKTLTAANLSISSAIIATYGEEAVDSFYVKDIFGLKITSTSKQKQISEKLYNAIESAKNQITENSLR